MARPLRVEYANAFQHVMNRGAARQPIFPHPVKDRALFLNVLGDAARLWHIRIHAYALMDTHYHLLIETPLPNLSRAMRHIDGVYTQRLNRTYRRDGPLFRGRYKSILIQKESYFLELVRYIHMNGVNALRHPHPAADPDCSHATYLGLRKRPDWLITSTALASFGPNVTHAAELFDVFVRSGVPKKIERAMARRRWPAILGDKGFVRQIRSRCGVGNVAHPEKPQERELARIHDPAAAIRHVASKFGLDNGPFNRTHRRQEVAFRRAAIYVLRHACQLSYTAIGAAVGGMTDAGVFYHLEKLKQEPAKIALYQRWCGELAAGEATQTG